MEQQQYFFDTLWEKAIPAKQRIGKLEKDADDDEKEVMENIHDFLEVGRKVFHLLKSSSNEILALFSTPNAFHRQERAGSFQLLKDIKSRNPKLQ